MEGNRINLNLLNFNIYVLNVVNSDFFSLISAGVIVIVVLYYRPVHNVMFFFSLYNEII